MSDVAHGQVRRVDQAMAKAAAAMLPREPEKVTKELRTRYRQLPVMVRTAGLAATYAFLVAKTDDSTALGTAYGRVATGIRKHLAGRSLLSVNTSRDRDVVADLARAPLADYARASAEVEALAGWLSRLGEAAYQSARQEPGQSQGQEQD